MRFFEDKHPDEDGTTYIRVHYASSRLRFLHGINPHVQLHGSEKLTNEKQETYGGLQWKHDGKFLINPYGRSLKVNI